MIVSTRDLRALSGQMTWRQTRDCSHSKEDVTSPSLVDTRIKCIALPCLLTVGYWPRVAWITKSAFGTLKTTNYWTHSQDTEILSRYVVIITLFPNKAMSLISTQ